MLDCPNSRLRLRRRRRGETGQRQWIACDDQSQGLDTSSRRALQQAKTGPLGMQGTDRRTAGDDRRYGAVTVPRTERTRRNGRLQRKKPQSNHSKSRRGPSKSQLRDIPDPHTEPMLEILLRLSRGPRQAWCCGFANRKPDGTVMRTTRNFHLDHQNPKSLPGFSHKIENRAPMCPTTTVHKSNRRIHLQPSTAQTDRSKAKEMMVDFGIAGLLAGDWISVLGCLGLLDQLSEARLPAKGFSTDARCYKQRMLASFSTGTEENADTMGTNRVRTTDEQKQLLARQIATSIARGRRVESQGRLPSCPVERAQGQPPPAT